MTAIKDKGPNSRFFDLTYDDFRKLARDNSLTKYERIGFPTSYRMGKEQAIFDDIRSKCVNLEKAGRTVVDIGPGCSDLPLMLIDLCRTRDHKLILIDSEEMLAHLPDAPFIVKIPAFYPDECEGFLDEYKAKVDVLICYSVFHYVFAEGRVFDFLDQSIELLADGGEFLIGDIPNISKRNRFFASTNGIAFHQNFMNTDDTPDVRFNVPVKGAIDDAVISSIVSRYRQSGFDVYWLPQPDSLPMSNRREDLLIMKP